MNTELAYNQQVKCFEYLFIAEGYAARFARLILSMRQLDMAKSLKFMNEVYITIKDVNDLFYELARLIFHNEKIFTDIRYHKSRIVKDVVEVIKNCGTMCVTYDEYHCPPFNTNDIISMTNLVIARSTVQYDNINETMIIIPGNERIFIDDIFEIVNNYIKDFVFYSDDLFERPKLKDSAVLRVAETIDKTGILKVCHDRDEYSNILKEDLVKGRQHILIPED